MNTINYQSYLCTENDFFVPETSSNSDEPRFPVKVYESSVPQYSSKRLQISGLNQPDIRAQIESITNLPTQTLVLANSTKLLASDVKFGGVYYYFKHPILESASSYQIDGVVTTNVDSHFIYLNDNKQHTFTYYNNLGILIATEISSALPVYICQNYLDLEPIYNLDGKTYNISLNNGFINILFSKPNVNVISTDHNIFDVTIYQDGAYPIIQYDPFYIVITEGSNTYVYNYSYINTTLSSGSYFYSNRFVLFNTSSPPVNQGSYFYYDTAIGFPNTNSGLQVPVFTSYVDGINIYNPISDSTILFGANSISKNIFQLEYEYDNNTPALYSYSNFFKTRIEDIDSIVYKYCEPQAYYLSFNHQDITFPSIPGQDVKNLNPFFYIKSHQVDTYNFKFNFSDYTPYINISTETLNNSYIYSTSGPVLTYLNSYTAYINNVFNFALNTRNIWMFVSIDGKNFFPLELNKYTMVINNSVTELTVQFNVGTIELYNYLTFGWLFGNTQLLSTDVIQLGT